MKKCYKHSLVLSSYLNASYISNTAQKMKLSIKHFFSKCDQIRWKLTEKILNGKLHFLFSVM